MIVSQTSVGGPAPQYYSKPYTTRRKPPLIIMISNSPRLELQPFGITAVDLRTALVRTNLISNLRGEKKYALPPDSIYEPAKEVVGKALRLKALGDAGTPAHAWSKLVGREFMEGVSATGYLEGGIGVVDVLGTILPFGTLDAYVKKMTGIDVVACVVGK